MAISPVFNLGSVDVKSPEILAEILRRSSLGEEEIENGCSSVVTPLLLKMAKTN